MNLKKSDIVLFNSNMSNNKIVKTTGIVMDNEDINGIISIQAVDEVGSIRSIFGAFTSNPTDIHKRNIISVLGNLNDLVIEKFPEYTI